MMITTDLTAFVQRAYDVRIIPVWYFKYRLWLALALTIPVAIVLLFAHFKASGDLDIAKFWLYLGSIPILLLAFAIVATIIAVTDKRLIHSDRLRFCRQTLVFEKNECIPFQDIREARRYSKLHTIKNVPSLGNLSWYKHYLYIKSEKFYCAYLIELRDYEVFTQSEEYDFTVTPENDVNLTFVNNGLALIKRYKNDAAV